MSITSPTLRIPTSRLAALAWWREAMRGRGEPDRHEDDPQCGWYQMRMVAKGHWVPVAIMMVQAVDEETGELTEPERIECLVAGQPADPVQIWTRLQPISREAYEALVVRSAGVDPKKKFNLMKSPRGPHD